MSRRFNLVPHDMFMGLVGRAQCPPTPDPPTVDDYVIGESKKAMGKLMHGRRGNKSARNLLYQDQLRNYIHQKRAQASKPVRVEVRNPLDPHKLAQLIVNKQRAALLTNDDDEGEGEEVTFRPLTFETPRGLKHATVSTGSRTRSTASRRTRPSVSSYESAASGEDEEEAEEVATPPQPRKPMRTRQPVDKSGITNELAKKLAAAVMRLPKEFNVDVKAKKIIGDRGVAMVGSDFPGAVAAIAARAVGQLGVISPAGTKILRSKIEQDPETKAILNEYKQTGGGTHVHFKPEKWRRINSHLKVNRQTKRKFGR